MSQPVVPVHLWVHSEFSVFDGIASIKDIVATAVSNQMPAVALTDLCNAFGMVRFFQTAIKQGVKPLMGVEVCVKHPDWPQPAPILLYAQSDAGWVALMHLITKGYQARDRDPMPLFEWADITALTDGVLVILPGTRSPLGQYLLANKVEEAKAFLNECTTLWGSQYYVGLHRAGLPGETAYEVGLSKIASDMPIQPIAIHPVVFVAPSDFEAHEAKVCIQEGRQLSDPTRPKRFTANQYMQSAKALAKAFADIPIALENTIVFAKRCNAKLIIGEVFLPDFPTPNGETIEAFLESKSFEGLYERLEHLFPDEAERQTQTPVYEARLREEIPVIQNMGFSGYFMIVSDFIEWAKHNDIPVGPGRGSGAGSLVAYCLSITNLDPIAYELLFERFLNPERVSMPDFDIDFCMDRRDEVINYVASRYGRDSVSQIATFGTMAAKAVVRDVGRVLGQSYGFVDKIAKLIPFEIGMTLEKAIEQESALKELIESDEMVSELITLAKKLEGQVRNVGKHAGGVVIAPSELSNFSPLYCEAGSTQAVTQFDKDDVEKIGLVKFDFLGLRTLTIIDWAVGHANAAKKARGEPLIDIDAIPIDDDNAFALLKRCETTAVFQLESRGMKDLIKRLQPDCFEDIIALVALFRPGPLQSGMVDDFINRKHGRAKVEYPHPDIAPILSPTYGVILYQEQVMQIAQVLACYTLGGADLLRRAMGKKKPEEMAKQRKIFIEGAVNREVDESQAAYIFDLMEKFAGYGFNKSHSAAYALVSYQTAWLKANYPACFMAAVLSSDMGNTDKVVVFVEECQRMGLTVRPPNINESNYLFGIYEGNEIQYGLGAIKGVGENALEALIEVRDTSGPYKNLEDLIVRVGQRKLNKKTVEALIKCGALDGIGETRAQLMHDLPDAFLSAEQQRKRDSVGQMDLFAGSPFQPQVSTEQALPEWPLAECLQYEKDTLGFYLSGHPMDIHRTMVQQLTSHPMSALPQNKDASFTVAGIIVALRTMITKRGDKMAFVMLDDGTGREEFPIFGDAYQANAPLIAKDKMIVISGVVQVNPNSGQVRHKVNLVTPLEEARFAFAKSLHLTLTSEQLSPLINGFTKLLQLHQGETPLYVQYTQPQAKALLQIQEPQGVSLSQSLVDELLMVMPEEAVEIRY